MGQGTVPYPVGWGRGLSPTPLRGQRLRELLAGVAHPEAAIERMRLGALVARLERQVEAAARDGAPFGLLEQRPSDPFFTFTIFAPTFPLLPTLLLTSLSSLFYTITYSHSSLSFSLPTYPSI